MAVALLVAASGPSFAQGCNPAVDGTYCASAGIKSAPASSSSFNIPTRFSLSEPLGPGYSDNPATIGAITFGTDGSKCIGLIRRSRCSN
jgi:hypothetical protein